MNKTDNEIIKALECCQGDWDCEHCSYSNKCSSMHKDAIDLINRQKAEIENLKDILYDADGVNLVNYWYQQCEIAENGCRNFKEENENLKAEIERLQAENEKLKNKMSYMINPNTIGGRQEMGCW